MEPSFIFSPDTRHATPSQILDEIRRISALDPPNTYLSYRRYRAMAGRYSATAIIRRFGSWNSALKKSGLRRHRYRIPDSEFFTQMQTVWRSLGKQPTKDSYNSIPHKISAYTYVRRFGSWHSALLAFSLWANSRPGKKTFTPNLAPNTAHPNPKARPLRNRQSPRSPSARLRHEILKRDNYKCVHCGQSPVTHPNITLHIDHILPWSKGGPTTPKNLQTLCNQCNHGKANNP